MESNKPCNNAMHKGKYKPKEMQIIMPKETYRLNKQRIFFDPNRPSRAILCPDLSGEVKD